MEKLFFADLCVCCSGGNISDEWNLFCKPQSYSAKISIEIRDEEPELNQSDINRYGDAYVNPYRKGWLFSIAVPEQGLSEFLENYKRDGIIRKKTATSYRGTLWMTEDYKQGIYYQRDLNEKSMNGLRTAMDAVLPMHDGIILHASCIVYKGKAILFMGPSGMGKSTQAKLWLENRDCFMLSSDAPAILIRDGQLWAYGMPWDGSDHIIRQDCYPVLAMINLSQETENSITEIDSRELLQTLLKQAHVPLWDDNAMTKEMEVLQKMVRLTEGYHLGALPNTEAVDMVCEAVYERNN